MIRALRHRGPDECGYAVFPEVALANTRLSIIDLVGGAQPIYNEDRSICIVYNGELYNAPELRAELLRKGHTFRSQTDTEVLVHLYEEDGDAFLQRLNGMFAFALHDTKRKRLLLARDRFGVKPLVYQHHGGELIFASEIKALREHPSFLPELDPEGLAVFLGLFYIPDPWTAYRHTRKLPPGYILVHDRDGLHMKKYYTLDYETKITCGRRDAEDEIARLLTQAVDRQMLSDVPVGVLLSGGLDSRSILMTAARHSPGLRAYTITFEEQLYNEGRDARAVAEGLGCSHTAMTFRLDEFLSMHLERQRAMDEPYALWCNTATAALARTIHAQGGKVVLSGEGGDEVFIGYPTVHALNAYRLYRLLPKWLRSGVVRPLVRRIPSGSGSLPLGFMMKSFVEADHQDLIRTFFGFKEVLRYATWPELLTPEALNMVGDIDPVVAFRQHGPDIEGLSLIDALTYLDFKVFLPGCSFVGNDNAYMSASVETRVPMMDNDLVAFACSLPVVTRFDPLRPKILLKNALQRHFPLPCGVRTGRYVKRGFEIPGNQWLREPSFRKLLKQVLSPEKVRRVGFFRAEAVTRMLEEQYAGKDNHERRIQAIMSLSLFLEEAA